MDGDEEDGTDPLSPCSTLTLGILQHNMKTAEHAKSVEGFSNLSFCLSLCSLRSLQLNLTMP